MIHIPIMKPSIVTSELTTGLLSVWEFNETSGTTAYDSHGSNNATISGASLNQSSPFGTSFYFNGDSYVKSTSNTGISGAGTRSVAIWVNRTSTNSDKFIYYMGSWSTAKKYTGWYYQSTIRADFHGSSHNTGQAFRLNLWDYFVSTYDGTTSRTYINGSPTSTPTYNVTLDTTNSQFEIGGTESYGRRWTGYLKQPAIWNRVLTTDEISALYNSGNGLAYTNW